MALKFTKVKGFNDVVRIKGLDGKVLEKALALNNKVLIKKENNEPKFIIAFTTEETTLNDVSLVINVDALDKANEFIGVKILTEDPESTLIAAVKHINDIYELAKKLAEEYDAVASLIEEA